MNPCRRCVKYYDTTSTFRGKNGYYIVGDEWYIQEITPSEGYNLDPTKYHVDACALGGESGLKDHKDEGTITNAEYHVAETHAYVSGAAKGAYGGSNTVREDEITQPVAVRKYKSDNSTKITPLAGAGFTVYLKRELDQFISTTSWRTTEFKDGTEDYYTRFFEAVTNGEVTAGRQAVTLSAIPVAKKYVDGNGPTAIPEFFTDSTGYGYSVPLNYGDYVMYETTVPNDQIGAAEACLFSIRGVNEKSTSTPLDLSEDYSILDPIYQTKLVLVKKDADTGETILKPGTQWLIYEVKDNGSLGGLIVQKDSTTNTFYGTESNPWTVDETGTITMLEPLTASSKYNTGRYYLAEVNAPEGYYNEYAAQGKPLDGFYFGIGNSMRYERRYYLSAGDGTYTTDPNLPESEYLHSGDHRVYDEISVVEYANPETRGVVTIEKRGEKLSTYGSSDLLHTVSDFFGFSDSRDFIYVEGNVDGAVYSIIAAEDIYAQDGHKTKWASAGDVVATVTTGASDTGDSISIGCDGIVTASHDKDGRVTLTLPLGRYTIREVQAPAGYVLDETEQTVEFVWDSQKDEYVYDVSGAADKDGVVSFFNERARGYGELLKVDSFDGAPMANVTFQLYTVDDIFNYKGERIVKADTLLGEVTTGEDGTLRTALGLPIAFEGSQNTGRYYFVEKETPRGYAENAAKYEFVLSYVDQKTPEIVSRIDAKNDPIPPEFNITKAVDKDTLQVRDCQDGKGDLTYTITVTNDKGIGKGAYITDTFDSYLKITDVSLTRNETQHEMAEKDGTAPYTYNVNHVGMFTFYVGDIYEGDTVTLTVHARVRNNIPAGTDILNKAFVDSPNNYAAQNDLQRAEYAVLRRSNDQYRKIIFDAQMYANTGAGTVQQAVDMATKDFLSRGIDSIVYKNGARHTISDYADMYVRTAERRAYLMGEGQKRQEWGEQLVIVNKRGGQPCPQCQKWIGKILVDDVYSGGKPDGKHTLLSEAMAEGFLHPRCKDGFTTYFPGISSAPDPVTKREMKAAVKAEQEENQENYAARQAEKYGRLAECSLDPDNRRRYQARAEEWEQEKLILSKSNRDKPVSASLSKKKQQTAPAWNKAIGPETWTAKQRKAMWSAEWGTTGKRHEEARLYGVAGKRLFHKKGGAQEVQFTTAEIKQMRGGVLTHNHPGLDYGCFSPNDINMLRYGKLSEMRCVTPKGVFRIQHPEKWSKEINSLEKIKSVYYDISNDTDGRFFERARMGEISFIDAENMAQEATVRELCNRFGIPFEFESWDSIREAIK